MNLRKIIFGLVIAAFVGALDASGGPISSLRAPGALQYESDQDSETEVEALANAAGVVLPGTPHRTFSDSGPAAGTPQARSLSRGGSVGAAMYVLPRSGSRPGSSSEDGAGSPPPAVRRALGASFFNPSTIKFEGSDQDVFISDQIEVVRKEFQAWWEAEGAPICSMLKDHDGFCGPLTVEEARKEQNYTTQMEYYFLRLFSLHNICGSSSGLAIKNKFLIGDLLGKMRALFTSRIKDETTVQFNDFEDSWRPVQPGVEVVSQLKFYEDAFTKISLLERISAEGRLDLEKEILDLEECFKILIYGDKKQALDPHFLLLYSLPLKIEQVQSAICKAKKKLSSLGAAGAAAGGAGAVAYSA